MKRSNKKLSTQVKERSKKAPESKPEYDGNIGTVISTGSTLLDLAISGGHIRGGGIPSGIMVEIFGPSMSGKTVLLCEIAGAIQRQGGQVMFHDPEARLNQQFAKLFGMDTNEIIYSTPDTIPEVFKSIRGWEPEPEDKVHGAFTDSLAALSTEMEMEDKDGMGMRRAKEFSEECRKTCRILAKKNLLVVCSNQVRQNVGAGPYEPKTSTPGGVSIGFYCSLRLHCKSTKKIKQEETIVGKEVKRIIGVGTQIEVAKNSVWEPFRIAPVTILFKYGIDDIRDSLKFIKTHTRNKVYALNCIGKLSNSIDRAIRHVEEDSLEQALRDEVIDLWLEIESKFKQERKPKR